MRNIEKTIIDTFIDCAYASNKSKKQISVSTRDTVITEQNMVAFEIWGSRIFWLEADQFYFSFCGHFTATTRNRLNTFCKYFNLGKFYQKNWDLFWTGNGCWATKIDTTKKYKITVSNGDLEIEVVAE